MILIGVVIGVSSVAAARTLLSRGDKWITRRLPPLLSDDDDLRHQWMWGDGGIYDGSYSEPLLNRYVKNWPCSNPRCQQELLDRYTGECRLQTSIPEKVRNYFKDQLLNVPPIYSGLIPDVSKERNRYYFKSTQTDKEVYYESYPRGRCPRCGEENLMPTTETRRVYLSRLPPAPIG